MSTFSPYSYYDAKGSLVTSPIGAKSCTLSAQTNAEITTLTSLFYGLGVGLLVLGGYYLMKAKKEGDRIAAEQGKRPSIPQSGSNMLWLTANITIMVVIALVIGTYEIENFTTNEISIVGDSNNFIIPVKNVFSFFQDGMLVKLSALIGSGSIIYAQSLFQWGLIGSCFTGILVSLIAYGITFMDNIYTYFLPVTGGLNVAGLEYWNLNALVWPAFFVQSIFVGSLIAAGNSKEWFYATFVGASLQMILFYATENILTHLGSLAGATLISVYAFVVVILLRFRSRAFFGGDNNNPHHLAIRSNESFSVAKLALIDALFLLARGVSLALQAGATSVLQNRLGYGPQYRLLILNTVEATFGMAPGVVLGSVFSICLGFVIKLAGARLIGEKQRLAFVWLSWFCIKGSVFFGLLATSLILIYQNSLPYYYAKSACMLNTNPFTAPIFTSIFGADFETAYTLNAVIIGLNVIQFQMTSTLYALLDIKFLGIATLLNFALVFTPINAALSMSDNTNPIYYQLGAIIPSVTLSIIYAIRIRRSLKTFVRMESELNVPLVSGTLLTPRDVDGGIITPRTSHLLRTA